MNQARQQNHQRAIRVFIIHSGSDAVFTRKLRNLLVQRSNAQVFTADDLSAGEKYMPKLRRELEGADVVVAVLTPASIDSGWVMHEIGAAWALEKLIVPVVTRREVLSGIPLALEGTHFIELTDVDSSENADKFMEAFEESIAATPAR
jgi:nucleoside 2-deoxyribosyltransferase